MNIELTSFIDQRQIDENFENYRVTKMIEKSANLDCQLLKNESSMSEFSLAKHTSRFKSNSLFLDHNSNHFYFISKDFKICRFPTNFVETSNQPLQVLNVKLNEIKKTEQKLFAEEFSFASCDYDERTNILIIGDGVSQLYVFGASKTTNHSAPLIKHELEMPFLVIGVIKSGTQLWIAVRMILEEEKQKTQTTTTTSTTKKNLKMKRTFILRILSFDLHSTKLAASLDLNSIHDLTSFQFKPLNSNSGENKIQFLTVSATPFISKEEESMTIHGASPAQQPSESTPTRTSETTTTTKLKNNAKNVGGKNKHPNIMEIDSEDEDEEALQQPISLENGEISARPKIVSRVKEDDFRGEDMEVENQSAYTPQYIFLYEIERIGSTETTNNNNNDLFVKLHLTLNNFKLEIHPLDIAFATIRNNILQLGVHYDVDLCLFEIKWNANNSTILNENTLSIVHVQTHDALSYIANGKQRKRFIQATLDFSVICEVDDYCYLYRKRKQNENRSVHEIIQIPSKTTKASEILGLVLTDNVLVIATSESLFEYELKK